MFNPFDSGTEITNKAPVICIYCNCYLNTYCTISSDGSWYCNVCNANNPPFHDMKAVGLNDSSYVRNYLEQYYDELKPGSVRTYCNKLQFNYEK